MSATLDAISNGRLEFGIGAGWYEREHKVYGFNFPPIKERFDRLREAIQIIRKMWTEERATFTGKYYHVKDAYNNPKPIQKPHPPIIVGASGEKTALRVAAELADICNIHASSITRLSPPSLTPQEYVRKLRILDSYAKDAGRRPADIKKSIVTPVVISKDKNFLKRASERITRIRKMARKNLDEWAIVGTPDEVCDRVNEYVKAGAQNFNVFFPIEISIRESL
jgi:alkanesulfonate monooxygenase SsuD/methylene tetrahydromethanopterin reductase-like flavin-dependent oxidoreductase (luciferase family)